MLNFKRGDTFTTEAVLVDGNTPTDLTGWSIRSQIRRNNQLIDELVVDIVAPEEGRYTMTSSAPTTNWPIATLRSDIEYTTPTGQIISTDTYYINCVEDITR